MEIDSALTRIPEKRIILVLPMDFGLCALQ
jgi:hypothetical protein